MNHSYMGPQTEWRKRAGAVIGARAATGQKIYFSKKLMVSCIVLLYIKFSSKQPVENIWFCTADHRFIQLTIDFFEKYLFRLSLEHEL